MKTAIAGEDFKKLEVEKEFGQLSEFHGRDIEVYRSANPKNTALYFVETERDDRKDVSAFFELIKFGDDGDHHVYIRFPNTDYFVEMVGGGHGSGRGTMITASGQNVWETKYKMDFKVMYHSPQLLLMIGDVLPEYNFMEKIAGYDKGNPFNANYPQVTSVNMNEVERVLSMKYLKLPSSVRVMEYIFKTKEEKPRYFCTDYPAYNFNYDNHRLRVIEGDVITDLVIDKFVRYRDGGTTIITTKDGHKLFSPQTMFPVEGELTPKWDDIELVAVEDEAERGRIIGLLKIDLAPSREDKNEPRYNEKELQMAFDDAVEITESRLSTDTTKWSLWRKYPTYKDWKKKKFMLRHVDDERFQ